MPWSCWHSQSCIVGLAARNDPAVASVWLRVIFDLRVFEHRLVGGERRLRLIELRLIDVALDAEELRSFRDRGAVLVVDRFEIALDARDEIDGR